MAGEMVKRDDSGRALGRTGPAGVAKKAAKHAVKRAAKHAAKHPVKHAAKHSTKHAEKHASKHAAKKSTGRTGDDSRSLTAGGANPTTDLAEAYHAMQRAGAVITLLEKETGGDLRELLHRGVEVYRAAAAAPETSRGARRLARAAAGLLKASEHLVMAGLYAAREKHLLNVPAPAGEATERRMEEVARRLKRLHPEAEGFAEHLCLMSLELLKRAEAAEHDVHLAYELTMAADGLSAAVEHWPEE